MTDLTRDGLDRRLASKEFIIHVHGQEHTSVETWNEGERWMQNWIAKFKSKLLPIIGAQVRDLTEKFRQKDGMAGRYRNT